MERRQARLKRVTNDSTLATSRKPMCRQFKSGLRHFLFNLVAKMPFKQPWTFHLDKGFVLKL